MKRIESIHEMHIQMRSSFDRLYGPGPSCFRLRVISAVMTRQKGD